ncbi:MAG: KTSC domain-containing protein [Candidatus Acidiferrum sp.]
MAFTPRKEGQPESVYNYAPFTAEQWEAFKTAPSLGSHFLKIIKPRVGKDLTCTKIVPEKSADEKEAAKTPEAI